MEKYGRGNLEEQIEKYALALWKILVQVILQIIYTTVYVSQSLKWEEGRQMEHRCIFLVVEVRKCVSYPWVF